MKVKKRVFFEFKHTHRKIEKKNDGKVMERLLVILAQTAWIGLINPSRLIVLLYGY